MHGCDWLGGIIRLQYRPSHAAGTTNRFVHHQDLETPCFYRLMEDLSRKMDRIMDLFAGKKTAVYLGNENAGDPKVTD